MFNAMSDNFKSRDIGLRAQKKILSRMATKNSVKMFIDDTTASLLDNLYRLAKKYLNNKKEAERLIKNVIKTVIKIGILHRNGKFSQEELMQAMKFQKKFNAIAMTVISFHEVEFSYDRHYLVKAFAESRERLLLVVRRHLTDKSLNKINSVFKFFGSPQFLDAVFKPKSEYKELLDKLVVDIHKSIDEDRM